MKVRIKFRKCGYLKFIGHLDVMRYFQKAFRRAEIDMEYSKGFSPHPQMSFASPLGVGLTSDGEYLDIRLNSCKEPEVMMAQINAVMAEGMEVTAFVPLSDESKPAMSLITAADYQISLKNGYARIEDFSGFMDRFMEQPEIHMIKKTKSGEADTDLRPQILRYSCNREDFPAAADSTAEKYAVDQVVYMKLSSGSVNNLKPDLVMAAFYDFLKMELPPFSYQYHRLDLYAGERSLLYAP